MTKTSSKPKLSPYQKAVREVAGVVEAAIKEDGHEFSDAVDQAIEGLRDDVLDYLAERSITPETKPETH